MSVDALIALVNMISNPVNSTVPIAAEMLKKAGTFDEKKLFGVTMLDVVRAKTFYAGKADVEASEVDVPVVGGHAGITILPLFSQVTLKSKALSDEEIKALTKRTQDGGTEVVEAKAGKGSATLSMAYAGAIFADACLKGLNGVPDVVECSFVQSSVTELPFFASKVRLGKNGVEEVLGLGPLSDHEKQGLQSLIPELKASIEKGIKFAKETFSLLLPSIWGDLLSSPTGRCSDGFLVIDFIAEFLGLPLVPPYLESHSINQSVQNFEGGVNFAVVGATTLDAASLEAMGDSNTYTNNSLGIQLDWFKEIMPYLSNTSSRKSIEQVETYVPLIIEAIVSSINELIELGAATLLVPGNLPIGCLPIYLTKYESSDTTQYDPSTG
ncbi:malate dehydrogenase mitochondrial [Prunus yedoensis var. nudiflora]|uniref:malate dehydrogenase n=1 Tax=Prunus yedoensis var. nudiflora TaxID=2094558 RepID=A0A314ZN10_PRUYE|nr:malate dehydrogenase mitochondrial [Prunus yedoensis var. nudiflora]